MPVLVMGSENEITSNASRLHTYRHVPARGLSKAQPPAGVSPVSDCSSNGGEDVLSRGLGTRQT